jgi:hypothetical protein
MYKLASRALGLGALVGVFALGPAQASTIVDSLTTCNSGGACNPGDQRDPGANAYWGGLQSGGGSIPTTADRIGTDPPFEVFRAEVDRIVTGVGTANLRVIIHTNYVPGSIGTGFGDLFLGDTPANLTLVGGPPHPADTFALDPDRFSHVVDIPNTTTPGVGGIAGTFGLTGTGADVNQSDDVTGVGSFRKDQAVAYDPLVPTASLRTATWAFNALAETLTFTILNETNPIQGSLFSTSLVVSWAMTCANDVLLGIAEIREPPRIDEEVPLPAGFLLMGTVLLGAGGVARWRRRRTA